jgi:hypothetical protein
MPEPHAKIEVKLAPSGRKIQITPGLSVQPAPLSALPAFALIEWTRVGDGKYEPRLVTADEWVNMSDDMETRIGLKVSANTLKRLGRAGFIRLRRPVPAQYQLHIGSLIEHLENCEEEDFWTEANVRKYMEAL